MTDKENRHGSLTLAGTGIKFLSHLTQETLTHAHQADKILFLVNDPLFDEWVKQQHPDTESLTPIYHSTNNRRQCYQRITDHIVNSVKSGLNICTLIYGHPCVFAQSGLHAIKAVKKAGFPAKILPAISAEDCLFADLIIDPGAAGCQSFEATDFLRHRRQFDPTSHLILWQIDVINQEEHGNLVNQQGLHQLAQNLLNHYSPQHTVILYEAAQYPGMDAKIDKVALSALPNSQLSPVMTLYIPPRTQDRFAHNL